jgi:14-3-3 protein epsilon
MGDYYRYLAEFAQQKDREKHAEQSLRAYKAAYKHALATLDAVHPTRLGLALNFSVFFHGELRPPPPLISQLRGFDIDVRKSPERACHLAKSAFDDAVGILEQPNANLRQTVRDSMMILQLLRDDLILWSGEIDKDESGAAK